MTEKILYLECYSGISGDMTVAALLDLGADQQVLKDALASLHVDGFHYEVGRVSKKGISACDFSVLLDHPEGYSQPGSTQVHTVDEEHHHHNHEHTEHDHDYLHEHGIAHSHEESHTHTHEEEHSHTNHHSHEQEHTHAAGHVHRNLGDILSIIEHGALTVHAKELAVAIFQVVAQAESTVHGVPLNEIHFHEVGAVDSIVDIIAAAVCIDNLGITKVIASPLYEGQGTVRCAHGIMPVPAPATAQIMRAHGVPMVLTENSGEMVTPTGAAIVAALAQGYGFPAGHSIARIGYGAGKKEFAQANVLRAMILEDNSTASADCTDKILELCCCMDDITGERLGYLMQLLFDEGAKDVYYTPIQMKKNRPGILLTVLCDTAREEQMTKTIFRNSSAIGLRRQILERTVMQRTLEEVDTPYGKVQVKHCRYAGIEKSKVEYESAKKAADVHGVTIEQVNVAVNLRL